MTAQSGQLDCGTEQNHHTGELTRHRQGARKGSEGRLEPFSNADQADVECTGSAAINHKVSNKELCGGEEGET